MGKSIGPPLAAFLFLALLLPCLNPWPAQAASSPEYLALGDSLAFGVGAADPSTGGYVPLTAAALRDSDAYRSTGLDLDNLSVPGATSNDLLLPDGQVQRALTEIQSRASDANAGNDVAMISIDIGGNDLLALAAPGSPCLTNGAADACREALGQVLSSLQQNLSEAIRQLHEAAPAATIYVLDIYNPYSGTGDPRETIADIGVQELNGVVGAVTTGAEGVKVASVYQYFHGRGKQWVAADGIHPNADGHRVLAEVLLATIQGRPVSIPEELLAEPAASSISDPNASGSSDDTTLALAIAVPLAFAAGLLVSGAYFVARGRA